MGKILLFASFVVMLATAGLGFINKGKLAEANDKASSDSGRVTALQNDLKAKTAQLDEANQKVTAVTAEKDQAAAALTTAQTEAEQAKASVSDITAQKTAAESQVTQLQADLASVTQERDQLKSTQAAPPPGPSPDQQAELEEQKTVITKLQGDLDSARSQLEVLQKERQNRLSKTMQNGLEGRILAVNPAWNFVVLSLGDKNGVVNNAELIVKRGRQMIGKVRITSVEPSTSIADIVANSMPPGTTISPGDQVIYQSLQD